MAPELGDDRQRRLRLRALALAVGGMTVLVALAWLWKAPQIEDDLEARTTARLRLNELPVDDLVVVANGRNVAVRGPVESLDEVLRIQALVTPLYGVRRLDTDGMRVRPGPRQDIELSGLVHNEMLVLDGVVSTEEQRAQLFDALAESYPDLDPESVEVSGVDPFRGDDDGRLAGFAALAEVLAGPETVEATVSIADGRLLTTAVVRTESRSEAVTTTAEQFAASASVTTIGVDVDQVAVAMVISPDLVLISGQVLSDEQRLRILRAAEAAVGPAGVEADVIIVDRPPAFSDGDERIDVALDLLEGLVTADATESLLRVADGQVEVEVSANSIDAAAALREQLAGSGATVTVVVAADPILRPADQVAALESGLDEVEAEVGAVEEFVAGSDQLTTAAREALREAVAVFAAHPDPVVRVVVHTDSRGSSSANLALSQRRAEQVVAYLVSEGVDPIRMVAVGAGETVLLVDPEEDDADYGRNRRIEFEVITS
ncbi:MAG: OmpA family protein [Acidimicrobiales bacterium]